LPTYSPIGYFVKQAHFHDTLPNKDLRYGKNQQPRGKHHGLYLVRKPATTQQHNFFFALDDMKEAFLAKEWNFSISHGSK
jgi:hypothetical protein